jgi:hypothetical protein
MQADGQSYYVGRRLSYVAIIKTLLMAKKSERARPGEHAPLIGLIALVVLADPAPHQPEPYSQPGHPGRRLVLA